MAIAQNENIADPTHVSRLPASWGTLYELSQLDDATFKRGVDTGVILFALRQSL